MVTRIATKDNHANNIVKKYSGVNTVSKLDARRDVNPLRNWSNTPNACDSKSPLKIAWPIINTPQIAKNILISGLKFCLMKRNVSLRFSPKSLIFLSSTFCSAIIENFDLFHPLHFLAHAECAYATG